MTRRLLLLTSVAAFSVSAMADDVAHLKAAEVVSYTWKKEPKYAGSDYIRWAVQVANKSDRNISYVLFEVSTYDAGAKLVATEHEVLTAIPAHDKRAWGGHKSMYGTEVDARVRITKVEFAN